MAKKQAKKQNPKGALAKACQLIGNIQTCTACNRTKMMARFYFTSPGTDSVARMSVCIECIRTQQGAYNALCAEAYANAPAFQKCLGCGHTLPKARFNATPRTPTGLNEQCRDCRFFERIYKRYGITRQEYYFLKDFQDNACANPACCAPFNKRRGSLDYDPVTKEVRGLLCRRCMSALSMLSKDVEKVRGLVKYLTARAKGWKSAYFSTGPDAKAKKGTAS